MGSNGSRFSLGAVQNNQFLSLCRVIDRPELAQDPRFSSPALRAHPQYAAELRAVLDPIFLSRHGAEWERDLNAHGVPCGLVRDIGQVCETLREGDRGLLLPTTLPVAADSASSPPCFINAGFMFEKDGPGVQGSPPVLAQHSLEILRMLGYPESAIAEMVANGAVKVAASQI